VNVVGRQLTVRKYTVITRRAFECIYLFVIFLTTHAVKFHCVGLYIATVFTHYIHVTLSRFDSMSILVKQGHTRPLGAYRQRQNVV
jgi:hypothetical protein